MEMGYVGVWAEAVDHSLGRSLGLDAIKCSLRSQVCVAQLLNNTPYLLTKCQTFSKCVLTLTATL